MREKVVKKLGRKPKKKTVEKRVEKLLTKGEEPPKRKPGRPAKTYDQRPDHIKFIIDCAALGCSPTHIVNLLKERYGAEDEKVISISSIMSYKKRYLSEIAQREKELRSELHTMLPSVRIRILQNVINDAREGSPVGVDKEGNVVMRKDHNAAIQAVKELNAMMKELDSQASVQEYEIKAQREVEEQKAIIREHIAAIKETNGESELEILRRLSKAMQKEAEQDASVGEAFTQLSVEYEM
jgi:DNA-binding transcriptional MerR regulator